MIHNRIIPKGGLRELRPSWYAAAPLHEGPDVSYLPLCRVGDDQGQEGACAIFALASWYEIMRGESISNEDCFAAYRKALDLAYRPDGDGLSFEEAFAGAQAANWFDLDESINAEASLEALAEQPLLAGYEVTPAWDNVSPQGCLDHRTTGPSRGGHAVCIVGHGSIGYDPHRWVWIENSWGLDWGWNGIGVMEENLHRDMILVLYSIRKAT